MDPKEKDGQGQSDGNVKKPRKSRSSSRYWLLKAMPDSVAYARAIETEFKSPAAARKWAEKEKIEGLLTCVCVRWERRGEKVEAFRWA